MSQHDFTIANQTASSARSDINSGLQALATNNSGASAPSTPFANMWWYDSANNKLYIRNENNTAWIEVANLDQGASRFEPVNAVPVGAVNTFAMNVAPTGWLACDGSTVSRTTYSGLFTVVGTTYGSGDGSTTFKVPDLRGEFVRGWDDGRGVDTGRSFASAQADEFKSHRHVGGNPDSAGGSFYGLATPPNSTSTPFNRDAQTSGMVTNFSYNTSLTGGSETRPRNLALLYCIKF